MAPINTHGDIKHLAVGDATALADDSFKVLSGADVIALTAALFMFDGYFWLRKEISRLVSHDPSTEGAYSPTPDTRSQDLIG